MNLRKSAAGFCFGGRWRRGSESNQKPCCKQSKLLILRIHRLKELSRIRGGWHKLAQFLAGLLTSLWFEKIITLLGPATRFAPLAVCSRATPSLVSAIVPWVISPPWRILT